MRLLMPLILSTLSLGLLGSVAARGAEEPFYLGGYTQAGKGRGIYLGTLDPATGKLGPLTLAAEAKNPSFIALSPDRRTLYAALESEQQVAAYSVQPDRTLQLLGAQPSGGSGPCFVSLDPAGKHLFVANYNSGTIRAFPIGANGTLGEGGAPFPFTGSGPDPKRQAQPHAHSIYSDPQGRFLYACDLGTDRVRIFTLGADASLIPSDPPWAEVPPGMGPRHLAWSPDGAFAAVINEMGVSVTVFARDAATGALAPRGTVSALPPEASLAGETAAEVAFHPSGKWLYLSSRGSDSLSVFAVGPEGRLELMENVPAGVKMPRSFSLDPSGQWLLAAGQGGGLTVLKIDPATGCLTPTGEKADCPAPVCVLFVGS